LSDIHITPELLEAVAHGTLPARALTEIGWSHLLNLCPTCREAYRQWHEHRAFSQAAHDPALQTVLVILRRHTEEFSQRRAAAEKDLSVLLSLDPEDRLKKINRSAARFRGVLLANLLLSEARKHLPADLQGMRELAEAAEAVLLRTSEAPGYYGAFALATAYKGNALRGAGHLREAEVRFAGARNLIRQHDVTDVLVYAEVDWLEGVLSKDQRRFAKAEELLTRSAALFQLAGEKIDATRPLVTLGALYAHRQELTKAIETTKLAIGQIDPRTEPRLYRYARHNLTLFLCEAGQYHEAEQSLSETRDLYEAYIDGYTQVRLTWIEGKIAAGLGQVENAERAFISVRQSFLDRGIGYDVAMVSLDLALLYAKEGRMVDLRQVAEAMTAIFAAEGIHREAVSALLLFVEAVRQDQATVELIQEAANLLRRSFSE
jgi:tetratricopeptide (TPR) repeat protein